MPIEIGDRDVQTVLEEAPEGATVEASSADQRVVSSPVTITTDGLTVRGLSLKLADGANANVVEIRASDVRFEDFAIDGAKDAQADTFEDSGVVVCDASNVLVRNGRIRDVDRHGVLVGPPEPPARAESVEAGDELKGTAVSDVTISDVRVDDPNRDGCSVQGYNVTNVHVERVRTFGSRDRGCVEANDGTSHVTIKNCYAEKCAYVAAVQDHFHYGNAHVSILHNTAVNCRKLVDTQTSLVHRDVSVVGNVGRNLTGAVEPWDDEFSGPGGMFLGQVDGLRIAGNRVEGVDSTGIAVEECTDLSVIDNSVRATAGAGISLRGTDRATVVDNSVSAAGSDGISHVAAGGSRRTGAVRIVGNRCHGCDGAGVFVDAGGERRAHSQFESNVYTENSGGELVYAESDEQRPDAG